MIDKAKYYNLINKTYYKKMGRVSKVIGLTVESIGPDAKLNDVCKILLRDKPGQHINAEVVGFKDNRIVLMPFENVDGIGPGCIVENTNEALNVNVGEGLLGKTVDGLGVPTDGSELQSFERYPVEQTAPDPMDRVIINEILPLGVKAVDGLLTIGKGQRIGIFAGSGVGKSTMLGMIARNSDADVNVVALIGERGREVKEFVENSLGELGMKKSVLVCATGDQPPLIRQKCLMSATAVCEYFRDQGKKVFLMTDTVTRCAMAGREVGLSIGEPPTIKGYPPSIFSWLQKVLERTGNSNAGSITALYTVLMEGDDINDPVVDTVRGIVDGHIFLSRKIAEMNHYPAIDVLGSVSRLFTEIVTEEHKQAAYKMRKLMAMYRENKDLIDVGMYNAGSNPKLDIAIELMPQINAFLQQRTSDSVTMQNTISTLISMMKDVDV